MRFEYPARGPGDRHPDRDRGPWNQSLDRGPIPRDTKTGPGGQGHPLGSQPGAGDPRPPKKASPWDPKSVLWGPETSSVGTRDHHHRPRNRSRAAPEILTVAQDPETKPAPVPGTTYQSRRYQDTSQGFRVPYTLGGDGETEAGSRRTPGAPDDHSRLLSWSLEPVRGPQDRPQHSREQVQDFVQL